MRLWQLLQQRKKQTFGSMHQGAQYNLTQGLLEKSKLAERAYKEEHKICWKEQKVFQIEPNTTYSKYRESAHIVSDRPSDQ
jgi:hypothetical protein